MNDHNRGSRPGRPEETSNPKLADVFADYADRVNAGESLNYEEILASYPDIGSELIEKLQILQTVDFGAHPSHLGTLGDYTLRRELGRGGMGVVYEAWQNSMDRQVALKVLPVGIAADRQACARFMREAQTAGHLSHPNVVPVHSMGVEENTPYYAMEYIEGETLAQILAKLEELEAESDTVFGKKDRPGYFENLAEAFADVADGLQHAHSRGVVHRDIKPSNLILERSGKLRILDFGLARLEGQESLTISGDIVGTPLYMSPEQARRKKVQLDHRTDVYSLGATLYEALTGRPPFRGRDYAETLSQIIERDPVDPRRENPRVPADLATIVLKCLRKQPADRYGTAEALAQDLRRLVRGDPVEARPESAADRFARKVRTHKTGIAVGGVIALLCVVCGLLAYHLWAERRSAELARVRQQRESAEREKHDKLIDLLKTQSSDSVELEWDGDPPVRRIGSVCASADGLTVYFDLGGTKADISRARRRGRNEPLEQAEVLPPPVNSPEHYEAAPALSLDGHWLYFTSNRDGEYGIYAAYQQDPDDPDARFDDPIRVSPLAGPGIELMGSLSSDGRELYFTKEKNISVAFFIEEGNPAAGFRRAHPLTALDTAGGDLRPSISADGTMLLFSDYPEKWRGGRAPRLWGRGQSDLWFSLRYRLPDGSYGGWDEPQNLWGLNSEAYEYSPCLVADGATLLFLREATLCEVPLVGFGCGARPLRARRTIHTSESISVHHGEERPSWTPGQVYRVTIDLTELRGGNPGCGPLNEVVIEESVPTGWTPESVSACGAVTESGTIRWTLRKGECGAAGFPELLSYEVEAGREIGLVEFTGTIREIGSSTRFGFESESDSELFSSTDFSPDGFIRRWLLLGPYQVEGAAGYGQQVAVADIKRDYLTDGSGTNETTVRPRAGDPVETDFKVAASLRLARWADHVEINPGGHPTWKEWLAEHNTVKFDEYYGVENEPVMMYAAVYVHVAEAMDVLIAFAYDDSIQLHLDGEPVFTSYGDRGVGRNKIHNRLEKRFEAGRHFLLAKVFDHIRHHEFHLRFEDLDTGEPLTEEDGIRICVVPEDCGF